MAVEIALTPDRHWPESAVELAPAAAAAGFSGLGIAAEDVDADAVNAYAAARLRCHELLALVVTDDVAATAAAAQRMAERAEAIGATWVLTVFTAALTSHVAAGVQRCAEAFADAGTGMAVEFSPLGPVPSIAAGLEVVRAARRGGRAGLVIDSWHVCHAPGGCEDLARLSPDDVAYVQFTDALAPESERPMRETLHRRALPGQGVLDLDRFAATLLERGWDGTVSVEVLSADLRALPVDVLVERLYRSAARYWTGPPS